MFSLHDDDKWETIAFYMGKFDGHQCHRQMKTLLQKYPCGCIFNLSLQQRQQLQEQEPPTCDLSQLPLLHLIVESKAKSH